jgi:hypothetical protein
MMEGGDLLTITVLVLAHLIIGKCGSFYQIQEIVSPALLKLYYITLKYMLVKKR